VNVIREFIARVRLFLLYQVCSFKLETPDLFRAPDAQQAGAQKSWFSHKSLPH
jgi:hypothetical protein